MAAQPLLPEQRRSGGRRRYKPQQEHKQRRQNGNQNKRDGNIQGSLRRIVPEPERRGPFPCRELGHGDVPVAARSPVRRYRLADASSRTTRVSMTGRSATARRATAGLPKATTPAGTSRATTDPAPMSAPAPIRTKGRMVTLTPICAAAPILGPAISWADRSSP